MDISPHTTMGSDAPQVRPEQPEQSMAARYGALIRVLQTIGAPRDPAVLFGRLATALRPVVTFDCLGVGLYDDAAHRFDWYLDERLQQRVGSRFPDLSQEETLTWWVYHHQEPVVMPCFARATRFPPVVDLIQHWGMQSGCTLPLTTVHCRLGVLLLGSEEAKAYSQDDLSFLSLVADQIALATEYALHLRVSHAAQDRLKLLLEERDRADATRGERARELRQLIDTIPQQIVVLGPDGRVLDANQELLAYYGHTLEEMQAEDYPAWAVHPDDLARVCGERERGLSGGAPFDIELRILGKDGQYRWFLHRAVPLRDELGHLVKWYGTRIDIEDRKRAEAALHWSEALLAGEKRVLEMIAQGEALPRILDALCRVVEEESSDVLSSFLLLDAKGTHLRHGAAPRLPQSYIDAIDGVAIGPTGGSCITAAYRAAPVVVSDIAADPLWAAYRHLPLAHGLRACWSTPIISSEGTVLGTFAMYYREPRSPSPHDLYVLAQVASVAAVSIKHKQAEESLRRSEAYLAEAQRLAHTGSWAMNVATGEPTHSSEEHLRLLGFDPETDAPSYVEFRQRIHPEDAHSALRADYGHINPGLRDQLATRLRHTCPV